MGLGNGDRLGQTVEVDAEFGRGGAAVLQHLIAAIPDADIGIDAQPYGPPRAGPPQFFECRKRVEVDAHISKAGQFANVARAQRRAGKRNLILGKSAGICQPQFRRRTHIGAAQPGLRQIGQQFRTTVGFDGVKHPMRQTGIGERAMQQGQLFRDARRTQDIGRGAQLASDGIEIAFAQKQTAVATVQVGALPPWLRRSDWILGRAEGGEV